eukprot:183243_1
MDALDIASLVWMSFNYVVVCPTFIYFLIQFNKMDKTKPMIKYRSKKIVNIINITILIILLFERVYANAISIWSFIHFQINWIYYLFFNITWCFSFSLFAIKVFHLYYKQQYAIAIKDLIWKQQIDPNITNWFIQNKNHFGTPLYCLKIIIIPFILLVTANAVLSQYYIHHNLITYCIESTIIAFPTLFTLAIFFKIKQIKDIYFIREEILYQCITLIIAFITYLSIFIYFHIYSNNYNDYNQRLEWLFRNLVSELCAIGLGLISTVYPFYLYHKKHNGINAQRCRSSSSFYENNCNKIDALKHIITNYNSYKAFMQYLTREFCAENVLFLTEIIMIKYAYQQKGLHNINEDINARLQNYDLLIDEYKYSCGNTYSYLVDNDGIFAIKLIIPSEIPKPIIIKENEINLRKQMKMIYNKYIKQKSEHEINLGSDTKNSLYDIFQGNFDEKKMTQFELFNIFDAAAIEILKLLMQPFKRFYTSDLFEDEFISGYTNVNKINKIQNKQKKKNNNHNIQIGNKISISVAEQGIIITTPETPFLTKTTADLTPSIYSILNINGNHDLIDLKSPTSDIEMRAGNMLSPGIIN